LCVPGFNFFQSIRWFNFPKTFGFFQDHAPSTITWFCGRGLENGKLNQQKKNYKSQGKIKEGAID